MKGFISVLLLAVASGAQAKEVARAEYGDDWPFATDTVTVGCDSDYALFFEFGGERYHLNNRAEHKGYKDPESLRTEDEAAKRRYADARARFEREKGAGMGQVFSLVCPTSAQGRGLMGGKLKPGVVKIDGKDVPAVDCPPGYQRGALRKVVGDLRYVALELCP